MVKAERQEQYLKEANQIKVQLDECIARLPKITFNYENRMTNIGPDSFDCYLGCTLNQHIVHLKNQYQLCIDLAEGLNTLVDIDEL